ncbi:hypothetical protein C41B8_16999 [Salinisphaera hydrothermalis C41B8]|uniref:CopG family transcriptional regulator n=2 Tax=Salinisphaera TaxID=180541 RepID=A0A084IH30_SALHC|nr:hypothetical protein C41B8_16999 [Salinisphaera hydrothermalis C41B8]
MKQSLNRAVAIFSLMVFALAFTGTAVAAPVAATLYHNPGCHCCEQYAQYLDKAGYDVKVVDTDDMAALNQKHGVPPKLASCHTMTIGHYVVVGHVPEPAIAQLLREQPDIEGISLPGMPAGSPGMKGKKQGPFVVRTLSGDVYGTY